MSGKRYNLTDKRNCQDSLIGHQTGHHNSDANHYVYYLEKEVIKEILVKMRFVRLNVYFAKECARTTSSSITTSNDTALVIASRLLRLPNNHSNVILLPLWETIGAFNLCILSIKYI